MLQQAWDFRDECEALHRLLAPLSDADFALPTQFKGWTLNDVLRHLHVWNWAADTALADEAAFVSFLGKVMSERSNGGMRPFERRFCNDLEGKALLDLWHGLYPKVAERFSIADPKKRVKWAGPDMSVRSSITARLMETWAHGQEVYDHLGVERQNGDRIQNIVVLGVNTYGWTFATRERKPPEPVPHVRLTAPSGALWRYNPDSEADLVEGDASEFCQVVTQVRNIADTRLRVVGESARLWMDNAQCFAGKAEAPPAPGTRFTRWSSGPANQAPTL